MSSGKGLKIMWRRPSDPIAVRFDKNAVMFFDRRNGTKLRFSIGKYEKASRPELVDIKITDWCDVGCSFCYQDSTLLGKHASLNNLNFVVDELAKAKVAEVALGGGETTSHPHFVEILKNFKERGVVPNFTTKKPAAVRKLWPEISDLIGGFAYSAETAGQVEMAARVLKGIPSDKVSLHYVMGLGDRNHFREYLKSAARANYRVTLLGYKTTGRGKDVSPHNYEWWMEEVSSLIAEGSCPSLSIDTPLAHEYQGQMPVAENRYHVYEGKFSLYIDAVALQMGASSFDEKEILKPFDKMWKATYKTI